MIQNLIQKKRLQWVVFMAILSFYCLGMSIFRVYYSGTNHFLFLNWNLFLAFIPWSLTTLLILQPKLQENKLLVIAVLGVWLIFFPNAPYILTDLFHLSHQSSMPIWFDLVLILSFAWAGLMYGFLSLLDLEEMLSKFMSNRTIAFISIAFMFAGSFGIYIGRYLRWNSWDLLNHPAKLLGDIGDRVINPFDHPRTWGITLFLGIFLSLLFWTFKLVRRGGENDYAHGKVDEKH